MAEARKLQFDAEIEEFSDSDVEEESDKTEEEVCAVCLLSLSTDTTRTLQCNHTFHESCVEAALKARNKCPMCNRPLGGESSEEAPVIRVLPVGYTVPYNFHQSVPRASRGGPGPSDMRVFPRNDNASGRISVPRRRVLQTNQPTDGVMTHEVIYETLPGFMGCNTIAIKYEFPPGVQTNEHPNPGVPYPETSQEAYLPDNQEGRELLELLKRAFDKRLIFTVGRSESSGLDNQIIWNGIPHKTSKMDGSGSFCYPDHSYLPELKRILSSLGIR